MNIATLPRQLHMEPVSPFAPKARSCPHNGPCPTKELCDGYGECKLDHTSVRGPDLAALEAALSRNRLDEIAVLMRALTYGEMMTLAAGFWEANGEQPITDEMLPVVLHRWSVGR